MNGKRAREQRRLYDARQYQIALLGTFGWDTAKPGRCYVCEAETEEPRTSYEMYDSGVRLESYLRVKSGEPDEVAANRMYREMNARQREGDFSLVGERRLMCRSCAFRLLRSMVTPDEGELVRNTIAMAAGYARVNGKAQSTLMVVCEPGIDGLWRFQMATTGEPQAPAEVYRITRREIDAGRDAFEAGEFGRFIPLEPKE